MHCKSIDALNRIQKLKVLFLDSSQIPVILANRNALQELSGLNFDGYQVTGQLISQAGHVRYDGNQ